MPHQWPAMLWDDGTGLTESSVQNSKTFLSPMSSAVPYHVRRGGSYALAWGGASHPWHPDPDFLLDKGIQMPLC